MGMLTLMVTVRIKYFWTMSVPLQTFGKYGCFVVVVVNQSISTVFNSMTQTLYNTQHTNTYICICESRTIYVK